MTSTVDTSEPRDFDMTQLRHPREKVALTCLVIFACLLFVVVGAAKLYGDLLGIGVIFLILGGFRYLFGRIFVAYVKVNAMELSDRQFPELYNIAKSFSLKFHRPLPTIYVMQDSAWNAFAMKIASKRLIILQSGAVDSLLLKGNMSQVAFVVGHELGHHYAGHLDLWQRALVSFGSWFGLLIGLEGWHQRMCELTSDRYGQACAGNLEDSMRAVCNMAVGAHLASEVNIDQAITQWNAHRSEFFVHLSSFGASHPHILCRLNELNKNR